MLKMSTQQTHVNRRNINYHCESSHIASQLFQNHYLPYLPHAYKIFYYLLSFNRSLEMELLPLYVTTLRY
jgi:hypothetical protein